MTNQPVLHNFTVRENFTYQNASYQKGEQIKLFENEAASLIRKQLVWGLNDPRIENKHLTCTEHRPYRHTHLTCTEHQLEHSRDYEIQNDYTDRTTKNYDVSLKDQQIVDEINKTVRPARKKSQKTTTVKTRVDEVK